MLCVISSVKVIHQKAIDIVSVPQNICELMNSEERGQSLRVMIRLASRVKVVKDWQK